ncbi:wall-associated receptor kinase 2-like [Bidens hawaiensis]|uniref:wall-associated receptor kinase 2-like n=1 Tax=Bidens hawaiensis TaxID=980011 RepID=UPI004049E350
MLFRILFLYLLAFPFAIALGTLQGSTNINNISKPNCPTHCGNVKVPYPFGIGNDTECSLDDTFHVTCNMTSGELFLRSSDIKIYNISDSELRIATNVVYKCYNENGTIDNQFENWWDSLSAFTFSEKNRLTVLGCDDYSLMRNSIYGPSSGCMGICRSKEDVPDNGQCSGIGCCQTSIPKGFRYYNVTLHTLRNHRDVWSFNRCGMTFLGEEGTFVFGGANDLSNANDVWYRVKSSVPVVVDWAIASNTRNCAESTTACKENSSCYDADGGGYRCRCNDGYEGNPYLDPGCQGQFSP